jgi:hypothetical protein
MKKNNMEIFKDFIDKILDAEVPPAIEQLVKKEIRLFREKSKLCTEKDTYLMIPMKPNKYVKPNSGGAMR